jgi:uncharacterized protein YigE (DUF2233 family)
MPHKLLSLTLALAMALSPALAVSHEQLNLRWESGEQCVNIIRFDPQNPFYTLKAVLSHDMIFGFETVSSMASRHGAVAAVNGGFFHNYGQPVGFFVSDGKVVSMPEGDLPVFGVNQRGDFYFGQVQAKTSLIIPEGIVEIDGINRPPQPGEVILYTPIYSQTTRYSEDGLNVVVRNYQTADITRHSLTPIPKDGFVIVDTTNQKLACLRLGDPVDLSVRLYPDFDFYSALQTGPWLIKNGRITVKPWEPLIGVTEVPAPRTAIGINKEGEVVLITVDGRQKHSKGMTLNEFAKFLLESGITEAAALDGGASTTMVIKGKIKNKPSMGRERFVGGAVIIVKSRIAE